MSEQHPKPLPKSFGRYEVLAKIAEGGMATVYVGRPLYARSTGLVALKVIKAEYSLNREFVGMFLDEAKLVSALVHPNVMRVYELGAEGQRLFIAMELLHGQSLWNVWSACRERGVRLRYDVAAWIGARVAEGLNYAHERRDGEGKPLDVVHRDVNPSNIFVTYDGDVKIIDFGLAKAANRVFKTAAGVIKGKVAYMSPEQALGAAVDRRTDIFALGTSLWELTVDQRLFKGAGDIDTLKRVHAAQVPDPTTLVEGYPPELWSVLSRALAREASDRFATAGDFSRALDACTGCEGRVVGPAEVSAVMNALFAGERATQTAWFEEAGSTARATPLATLLPAKNPSLEYLPPLPPPPALPQDVAVPTTDEAAAGAVPPGDEELFAPPSRRVGLATPLPPPPGLDLFSKADARARSVTTVGTPTVVAVTRRAGRRPPVWVLVAGIALAVALVAAVSILAFGGHP